MQGKKWNFMDSDVFFPMAEQQVRLPRWRRRYMSIGTIILIILIIALLGGFSGVGGGPFYGTGYYGGGGLGLIIVPVDPASARKDLTCWPNDRSSSPANAGDPVRRGASVKIAQFSGILDTPLSRSMTAVVIRPRRSFPRQLLDRGLYR